MPGIKGMRWKEEKKFGQENVWCRLTKEELEEVEKVRQNKNLKARANALSFLIRYAIDKIKQENFL